MEPTRVIFWEIPRMLREIIERALAAEDDFEVVELPAGRGGSLAECVRAEGAGVVLTQLESGLSPACRSALRRNPEMRILGLRSHAREAFLIRLEPSAEALGAVTLDELPDVLRRPSALRDPLESAERGLQA